MTIQRAVWTALLLLCVSGGSVSAGAAAQETLRRERPQPQTRPHSTRVVVDPDTVRVEDGDTVVVKWAQGAPESIRILAIDAPETRNPDHDLPYGQPFGEEARAFAQGVFASANRVELLRAATLDTYGRTLGYLFVDGENYSVLIVRERLAEETVSRFGDNGLAREAAEVTAAARAAGPLPFESPGVFRARMREVSRWLKARGAYPVQ